MDQSNQTQCVNCQTVTTSDGKTVWVCENCGEVNSPLNTSSATPAVDTPATPAVPAAPVTEQPPVVDVSTAQAELDQAASQLASQPAVPAVPTTSEEQSTTN